MCTTVYKNWCKSDTLTEEELEQIIAEESKKRHEKEAVEDARRVPDTNLLDISDDPNSSNSD